MKTGILCQYGLMQSQRCGGDDPVGWIPMRPRHGLGFQPDVGSGVDHLQPGQGSRKRGPFSNRNPGCQFSEALLSVEFPERDRCDAADTALRLGVVQHVPGLGRKLWALFKPPKLRVRIDHHGLRSSSCSTFQSVSESGSISSLVVGGLDGPPAAYSRSTRSVALTRWISRISRVSRPWSVTINGSPEASTSRKYSSISAFSLLLETVFTPDNRTRVTACVKCDLCLKQVEAGEGIAITNWRRNTITSTITNRRGTG